MPHSTSGCGTEAVIVYGERYLHNKYEYQHFVINSMQYTNIFNFDIYIQSIAIH